MPGTGEGSQTSSSEVGSKEKHDRPSELMPADMWREMLQAQNAQMQQFMLAMMQPQHKTIILPEFNPDEHFCDPKAWCTTVDLCMAENPLAGAKLVLALSRSLKGSASCWLSQITFPDMSWNQFKNLFLAQYHCTESPAAALMNSLNGKPKEGECYSAYAGKVLNSLMASWKGLTVEQIGLQQSSPIWPNLMPGSSVWLLLLKLLQGTGF
uniref:Uncharacterized protein n=1 Tax=Lygus hesperus TaxID=30085 RepID=A0A0K8S8B9_LYGHE